MHAAVLPTDFPSHQEYFEAALAANARLIRRGISDFRADPVSEGITEADLQERPHCMPAPHTVASSMAAGAPRFDP